MTGPLPQQSEILVIDPETGTSKAVSPEPPLLSSARIGIDGFVFERQKLRADQIGNGDLRHNLCFVQVSDRIDMEWMTGGRWEPLTTHEGAIGGTPAGSALGLRWQGELDVLLFSVDFEECARRLPEVWPKQRMHLRRRFNFEDPQLLHLAKAFRAEAESACPAGRLYGESLAAAFAVSLLSRHIDEQPEASPGGLTPGRLRRVIDYIQEHLERDLSLVELAAVAHISPYHFTRLFKQSTGITPHQYVLRRRVDKAKHLLKDEKLSIAEIAYATGFPNQAHFTTMFRRFVGVTPAVYRKKF